MGKCRFNANIDCAVMECGTCGWNPSVEEKRKIEMRKPKQDKFGLAKRLKDYKEKITNAYFEALADQSGGNVTANMLRSIIGGEIHGVSEGDLKRINDTLSALGS